jgi:hypothetical protein
VEDVFGGTAEENGAGFGILALGEEGEVAANERSQHKFEWIR